MSWLIAEDEADIRNLIATMIQVWGHIPVAYENGQKVWDWLDTVEQGTAQGPLPELVLMDIRMPGKKGNELANRMRSLPNFRRTPIVLMTAFSLSENERMEMIQQDGVDQIIHKPLPDFEQLRILLHNIVTTKQNATAAEQPAVSPQPTTPTTPTSAASAQNGTPPAPLSGATPSSAADTVTRQVPE